MISRCAVVAVAAPLLLLGLVASAPAQTRFKFDPVVRAGDPAPAPPTLGSILEFSSNQQGDVAVIGDGGLFIKAKDKITVITAPGDPSPVGGVFLDETMPLIDSQDRVLFRADVTSFDTSGGLFLFSNGQITQVLADGVVASNGQPVSPLPLAQNASGDVVVADGFADALYLFSNGSLTPLVSAGQPAPGGGNFALFFSASLNNAGQVAFEGFLDDGGIGIYLISGGGITKIIATGDPFADGATFTFPTAPAINDFGQIAFGGGANNSVIDDGLFLYSNGELKILVTSGTSLPSGDFTQIPFVVTLNNAGQIAFVSPIGPISGTGVFLFSQGELSELEATGEQAPDGDTFTNNVELGARINDSGQVIFFGSETQRGATLYSSLKGQITPLVGQGDLIPAQPQFAFPIASGIGRKDSVLISDSTFPGGTGAFIARSPHQVGLVANIGKSIGSDGVIDFLSGFAMNRENQVALSVASSGTNSALLLASGATTTVLADDSSSINPDGSSAINNLGGVAFTGFVPATGQSGLFLDSGGITALLVDASAPLPTGGFLNITNPAVNDFGQAVFFSQFSFPTPNAIYLETAGQITPLARDGDPAPGGGTFSIPFAEPRFAPVINDQGQVAFATSLNGVSGGGIFGEHAIFLLSQGVLNRLVGPGDPSPDGGTFVTADSPSMNASGEVAFFAQTSVPTFGIFVYSNGIITNVAAAGEIVGKDEFGLVDMPQINDDGHIAFTANVFNSNSLDGENAIFVASPKHAGDDSPTASLPVSSVAPPLSPQQMKQLRSTNLRLLTQRNRKKDSRKIQNGYVIASH